MTVPADNGGNEMLKEKVRARDRFGSGILTAAATLAVLTFAEAAWALGTTGGGGGGEGGGAAPGGLGGSMSSIVMMVAIFGIFYFLLIRPQQKKQKQHKEMLSRVGKGDKIITSGGIYGTVTGASDTTLTIEIAPKIRVKIARGYVAGLANQAAAITPDDVK